MVAVDNLSLQLYTVRGKLEEDFDATLARIAEIGYTKVEPFGVTAFADRLAEALPKYGLSAPTTHAGLLREDSGPIFAAAKRLGITTVIDPHVDPARWQSADDIKATAEALNKAAVEAADHGITVGYHNHQFELESKIDGVHGAGDPGRQPVRRRDPRGGHLLGRRRWRRRTGAAGQVR